MGPLAADITLELESWPQSVTLVRGMIAGAAEELQFDPELQDDLKTAVSEACNNVVMHAYEGVPGPLTVGVSVARDSLTVTVRDAGVGIRQIAASEDRMGVGLAVISALSERAEFVGLAGGGTEVRMSFPGRWRDGPPPLGVAPAVAEDSTPQLQGSIRGCLGPAELIAPVLGRITRVLAAGTHFSLDRFSDLYLVMDNLSAHAREHAVGDRIRFGIESTNRRLDVEIGPFTPGSGQSLTEAPRGDSPLARLADSIEVKSGGDHELLKLVLLDERRSAARA